MREISTKKIEIGEHVLIDGVEYVAVEGSCCACELGDYSDCDYALFCPVGGKLTKVKEQHTETQDKDTPMTYLQLAEWLSKGNGMWKFDRDSHIESITIEIKIEGEHKAIDSFLIRPWGTDEWVKPTMAIYERDCR